MQIRKEALPDYDTVYHVVQQAFKQAEHADGSEADLVTALRKGSAFIPELSLVAEIEGKFVGHILFTKEQIADNTVLALAPLAVLPTYQGQGIGAALVNEGHRIARQLGYDYVIVLGGAYYQRFGYVSAGSLGITAPFEVPDEYFMAKKLNPHAEKVNGVMNYAKEFGIE